MQTDRGKSEGVQKRMLPMIGALSGEVVPRESSGVIAIAIALATAFAHAPSKLGR